MTVVLLVRHGQTEWNREERFRGRADLPLNEKGLQQARLTATRILAEWQPAAFFSSPLLRAVRTAEAVASVLGLPVVTDPDLIDVDYGEWQGLTFREVEEHTPGMLSRFFSDPYAIQIPGGEHFGAVQSRALVSFFRICDTHQDDTVMIVGHAVLNRILLVGAMGFPADSFWRLGQDTCAISVLEVKERRVELRVLNDTCHLKPILLNEI